MKEQQTFLDESLLLWSKFQTQCVVFEDWLSRAEELVNRDSYGYTLKETEDYCTNIKVHVICSLCFISMCIMYRTIILLLMVSFYA